MKNMKWMAACLMTCGILDEAANGAMMEAVANRHKKGAPRHVVVVGIEEDGQP